LGAIDKAFWIAVEIHGGALFGDLVGPITIDVAQT